MRDNGFRDSVKPGEDLGDNVVPGVGEVILFVVDVGVVVRPDQSASSGIASEDLRSSGSVGWWSDKWGQWGLDERAELLMIGLLHVRTLSILLDRRRMG